MSSRSGSPVTRYSALPVWAQSRNFWSSISRHLTSASLMLRMTSHFSSITWRIARLSLGERLNFGRARVSLNSSRVSRLASSPTLSSKISLRTWASFPFSKNIPERRTFVSTTIRGFTGASSPLLPNHPNLPRNIVTGDTQRPNLLHDSRQSLSSLLRRGPNLLEDDRVAFPKDQEPASPSQSQTFSYEPWNNDLALAGDPRHL